MKSTRRSFVYVAAGFAAFVMAAFFLPAAPLNAAADDAAVAPVAFVEGAGAAGNAELLRLAQRDPAELTRRGMARYQREVREYACVFVKQERIDGALGPVQEVEVRYREEPHSVYMLWRKNADGAKRALYVDSPAFVDGDGEKAAKVEPAGAIARLFVSEIMMDIDGPQARQASRRTIDEFGFKATVRLLDEINAAAVKAGVLNYRFAGTGEVDGRPTFVLIRDLPYSGPHGAWPDARLVMHVDQEWLLPTALYSYADHEGRELLGSYVTTQVRFNPGFGESGFRF